jgi:hypothetical protein
MEPEFRRALQVRTAQAAIGASALRNQGAPGVVKAARDALARVKLARLAAPSQAEFAKELDRVTDQVWGKLPPPTGWGTARKALNLFLRDVLYNTYLARDLHFARVERWLELPLDSFTIKALRRERSLERLPRWPGVATVDPETYAVFQATADDVARERGIARVHLDVFWWRQP